MQEKIIDSDTSIHNGYNFPWYLSTIMLNVIYQNAPSLKPIKDALTYYPSKLFEAKDPFVTYLTVNRLYETSYRQDSFDHSARNHLRAYEMATTGLFYHREKDSIMCHSCRKTFDERLLRQCDLFALHWIISPDCRYTHFRHMNDSKGPRHKKYATKESRLASFATWSGEQTAEDMAAAGFFSTGEGDRAKCFYCDATLKSWEPTDKPMSEHKKWAPGCLYLDTIERMGVE